MKNMQIRQNCWETNSSSTHAVTLNVLEVEPTMKPYSKNNKTIVIEKTSWEDYSLENWKTKMHFLGEYLGFLNRKSEFSRIEKLISDFAGFEIVYGSLFYDIVPITLENENELKTEKDYSVIDEEDDDDYSVLMREFSYFSRGYESCEEFFQEDVEKILSSDDMILSFICSDGWFEIETYYDG